ncbi:Acyl-CoA dehydrogenase domain protein OS=Tsukamurella paurometabola (strain ATCC 8368 / DSM/ CCUG 35730 / CIP 100753 / JCM 10117 / KCTC 9821 / NBRC 16120/ NCIMB 702349 / NCTC 13040) OX=521096 GN=Tpau_3838 PE=3 SV=1 [Tsukamurella paurometabola]|uniref:Acyl-CoA dehydrogenase domain protein n=1 Tax=Tsukamurella paurometabola (strain ATCC 8368 / DSM 20162 / CCUG 35730 / CIP 100753 / JCM 10117 / KCTC 9821 / NBRC 16120 / NCIMB 702349 / NCTC 13040) TaxID=521096 RepID=D5UYW0_TSUPD|nr:acyl-CoA dehydrogenase family protein [Tsukamurella paurometabola]ADG80413.1 acyl-CoA dehydrogenase domain protein [Tsukamurella paurometabola DSM 20162]SUP39544.1 Crotonobetainyl-CoA dehydrogenase [Tsukamurella paurometabola]
MDLDFDDATVAFRDEVRSWLTTNVPAEPLPSFDTAEGFAAHRRWEGKLADAGLAAVSWPAEFGGRDATLLQWVLFEEEYYAAGAPLRVNQNGLFMLAPTLFSHGTDEQRARILPAMARSERVWAQAWSEPEAGSDIAALRSTASRVEGGWRLSGQKTWSSRAAFADSAFGLFRSDPGSERHRGLTYLMFDLHAPGVTVRPIPQLDGEPGFAEIFLDEVFVPDADVIGEPGQGWRVAMTTANNERGLSLRSPGRFLSAADALVGLWDREDGAAGTTADRVVDAWIGARAYQLYTFGTVTRLQEGGELGPESSVNKLFWSHLDVGMHETALDLLGPRGELVGPDAPDGGRWPAGYLFSLAGPIYGGTDQIQRNTIAERLLGLPRGAR